MTPDDPATEPRPTNPAAPARAPDAVREGDYLVVRKVGAKLPAGCILCNLPEAKRVRVTVRKFNLPLRGPILLFSPILLVMSSVAPMAKFEAGLCSAHVAERNRLRRPRLKFVAIALAMFLLGVVVASLGPAAEIIGGMLVLVSLVLLPIALLVALLSVRPLLKAHYSDGRYLWVDGVSPQYLQQLAEIGGES
jgi:hypothetical protein